MHYSIIMDTSQNETKLEIDVSFVDRPPSPSPESSPLDVSGTTLSDDLAMEMIDAPIVLNLYVNRDMPELVEKYKEHIQKHNTHVDTDPYPNSGFDLFVPQEFWSNPDKSSVMVNHHVKCEMVENGRACGFFSFPRSSISKTPLLLANHTGIIDAGYRGYLFGAFRNLSNMTYKTVEGVRLLQICHPSLKPFKVRWIENEEHLSTTSRGTGGFGSTGA